MERIDFIKPNKDAPKIDASELIDASLTGHDLEEQSPIVNEEIQNVKKEEEVDSKETAKRDVEEVQEELSDLFKDLVEEEENDIKINKNETSTELDFTDEVTKFLEEGFILDIPDDLNPEEDQPVSKDLFNKILEHNIPLLKENAVVEALSQLSEELQQAILFEQQGGEVKDYLNVLNAVADIKNLDPTNQKDQIAIVSEFYLEAGLSQDDVNEKINDLKKANLLQKEATKLKPRLDEKAAAIAKAKEDEQLAISQMKEKADQYAANRITEKLVKGFETFKFDKSKANDLFSKVMVEQQFNYGNKVQKKTGIEYLIDFHKYSETGSPERLLKALMILDPSGSYDNVLESSFKNKVTEDIIRKRVADTEKRYETTNTNKTKTNNKKFELKG
jgi:hypothetical protein